MYQLLCALRSGLAVSRLDFPPVPGSILIADDNPDDLFFASRAIKKAEAGAIVVTCADGREVVEALKAMANQKEGVPRAVFLDIKMPNLDGFETLRWIRAQENLSQMTVVMLTGSGEARDIALARSLGANDYLVKYPEPADFARVMKIAEGNR
jgi:two-component system, response regulator